VATLAELEVEFRLHARDMVVPYKCRTIEFNLFLNQAVDEACRRKSLIFDRATTEVCEIDCIEDDQTKNLSPFITEVTYASLTSVSGGDVTPLYNIDKVELERTNPNWRENKQTPTCYMIEDNVIVLDSICDQAYTLKLEVYRTPLEKLKFGTDEPVVNRVHHSHLLDWCYYSYFSLPQSDIYNPDKATAYLNNFTAYFGVSKMANLKRDTWANRSPHNKNW